MIEFGVYLEFMFLGMLIGTVAGLGGWQIVKRMREEACE